MLRILGLARANSIYQPSLLTGVNAIVVAHPMTRAREIVSFILMWKRALLGRLVIEVVTVDVNTKFSEYGSVILS